MLAQASLFAIRGYQRWLSPRKGYACAYRVLNGGTGCSGFAKAALAENGFWQALPLIRQRFGDCAQAARELRARCRCHGPSSHLHPDGTGTSDGHRIAATHRDGIGQAGPDPDGPDPNGPDPEQADPTDPAEKKSCARRCRSDACDGSALPGCDGCFTLLGSLCRKAPAAKAGANDGDCSCGGCDCGG